MPLLENPLVLDGCEKESLTALFMYSADGIRAPPMLMFKYADRVPASILNNFPSDSGIGFLSLAPEQ